MKLFTLALLVFGTFSFSPLAVSQKAPTPGQIETTYDDKKDRTTVRLTPLQVSGEKAQYHSVHIAPSFSYPGRQFKKPDTVDFEVQTVVTTKLKIDLYVVFVVDGEKIFLSSGRRAVKHPVPGQRWIGERLVFRMPYDALMKITKAKAVAIKMDGVEFPFSEVVLDNIRTFASSINSSE